MRAWAMCFSTANKQPLRVFYNKSFFTYFVIFTGEHLCWSLFLIKLQAFSPVFLLKRDSNTGAFPWIVRNFEKHLFHRRPSDDCFSLLHCCSVDQFSWKRDSNTISIYLLTLFIKHSLQTFSESTVQNKLQIWASCSFKM